MAILKWSWGRLLTGLLIAGCGFLLSFALVSVVFSAPSVFLGSSAEEIVRLTAILALNDRGGGDWSGRKWAELGAGYALFEFAPRSVQVAWYAASEGVGIAEAIHAILAISAPALMHVFLTLLDAVLLRLRWRFVFVFTAALAIHLAHNILASLQRAPDAQTAILHAGILVLAYAIALVLVARALRPRSTAPL